MRTTGVTTRTRTTTADTKGIKVGDVSQVLLTHIHLDHAGVTGTLIRENPAIEVLVHERGAGHLIDPTKLIASATRLYGEADMERLWGEGLAVPAANVRRLSGGETLSVVGREIDVADTPGHASHHVSYFDRASRVAFVGDTAGIRRESAYVTRIAASRGGARSRAVRPSRPVGLLVAGLSRYWRKRGGTA